MIVDLISSNLNVRLISKNVISVFSTNSDFTDNFILKLKHSKYNVNGLVRSSDDIICYIKKTYNIYENILLHVQKSSHINSNKFIEYMNYIGIHHLLWLNFHSLEKDDLSAVEILMQLSSDKPIIVIDYIDDNKYKEKLYSLLFYVALLNKVILLPFRNIFDAVNFSTCQCYVKDDNSVKLMSRFPNVFLNEEFHTDSHYYKSTRPSVYVKPSSLYYPNSYKYSLYELFLILMFSVKLMIIKFNNWRLSYNVNRLHSWLWTSHFTRK